MRRAIWSLSVLILLSAGCKESPIRPGEPVTMTFSGTVNVGGLLSHTFTSDRRGIATAVLTWASGGVDLDFYVTDASCTTNPFDPNCPTRVFADAASGTTERLIFGVVNAENLKLWVSHFAGGSQNYTINLTIE